MHTQIMYAQPPAAAATSTRKSKFDRIPDSLQHATSSFDQLLVRDMSVALTVVCGWW